MLWLMLCYMYWFSQSWLGCSWMCVGLVIRMLRVRPPPVSDPPGQQHSFAEIDHEIFSMVIFSLLLIEERQLSISGKIMCTILVNHLEAWACPVKVWLGKLTTLDMTAIVWLGCQTSAKTNVLVQRFYSVSCLILCEWPSFQCFL